MTGRRASYTEQGYTLTCIDLKRQNRSVSSRTSTKHMPLTSSLGTWRQKGKDTKSPLATWKVWVSLCCLRAYLKIKIKIKRTHIHTNPRDHLLQKLYSNIHCVFMTDDIWGCSSPETMYGSLSRHQRSQATALTEAEDNTSAFLKSTAKSFTRKIV